MEWGVDMGTLISQDQLDTVQAHVDDAVAKGARVLAGGRARPDLGPFFFEPTILEGVTPDMTCFGNETFGPVISLYRFHDEADAIARANAGEYGLNASIYTQDGDRGRAIAREIKCGTVNINEAFGATFASIDSPMGGMRQSGMGRRQGSEGIHRYTESQSVATQRGIRFAPMFGMSDEGYAKLMTAQLRLMKKLGARVRTRALRRPRHRIGLRRVGHRAAADREGLQGRRARGRCPLRGRATSRRPRATRSASSSAPELGLYGIQRIDIVNDCLILAGAGVGGGSLVYANTLYEPLDAVLPRPASGRTSPTGSPSWRPTTTRPSGCWA